MYSHAESRLLRILRVPPEPAPPEGDPQSIRVFRAGRNYYRWRVIMWALAQVAVLFGVAATLAFVVPVIRQVPQWAKVLMFVGEVLTIGFAFASMPFTYFLQRLEYNMRWYIVTDHSLRIRGGVWSVEELTMTFANIQDLRVTAGPLQRLLGIADLEVSSAGGSASAHTSHRAAFAGIDNADTVRDFILERLRRYRDAGLGDPGDELHAPPAVDAEQAAITVLEEVRALRAAITHVS